MRYLLYVLYALLAVVMAGCGNSTISERVSSAEIAFAGEDVASARRICDEIVGEHNEDGEIAATELGRMSILYMQLFDRTDDADALDLATKCYRSAYEENADSAAYFYSHLPVEQDKYAMSLAILVQSMDNPADISDSHFSSHEGEGEDETENGDETYENFETDSIKR